MPVTPQKIGSGRPTGAGCRPASRPRRWLGWTPAIVGCCLAAVAGAAEERPSMTGPPPGIESAKRLTESIADACNRKDFIRFMTHFSPKHAGRIRRRMEDLFVQCDMQMEIEDVILLDEQDDKLVFGVRYLWHERSGPRRLVASRVTAVRTGDTWKVDAEEIQRVRVDDSEGGDSSADLAAGCAGGQCGR